LSLKIIRPGDEPGQGVGYLNDGTMVVVEQARDKLNHTVIVGVTNTLQTNAGRMIFGRIKHDGSERAEPSNDRDAQRRGGDRKG